MTKRWRRALARANRLRRAADTFYSSRMRTLRAMGLKELVHYLSPPLMFGTKELGMPLTHIGCQIAASLALDGMPVPGKRKERAR